MLGEFYCARFDAPLLAEVVREGVVYARASMTLRGPLVFHSAHHPGPLIIYPPGRGRPADRRVRMPLTTPTTGR